MAHTLKCQDHIACSFAWKVVCVDNRFSKKVVLTAERMLFTDLLKQFLKSMIIAKNDKIAF